MHTLKQRHLLSDELSEVNQELALDSNSDAQLARQWIVRSFRPRDSAEVKRLSEDGLLPGYIPIDVDELDGIQQLYLDSPRGHFWVAEAGARLIGTLALKEMDRHVAQLRWLRIAPVWQAGRGVAKDLIRVAANHAREMGFLKLTIHLPPARHSEAAHYFHLLAFEFSRNITSGGRDVLEFYLNLYAKLKLS